VKAASEQLKSSFGISITEDRRVALRIDPHPDFDLFCFSCKLLIGLIIPTFSPDQFDFSGSFEHEFINSVHFRLINVVLTSVYKETRALVLSGPVHHVSLDSVFFRIYHCSSLGLVG